jgi:NADH dehydrogenase FAD-containing subunit
VVGAGYTGTEVAAQGQLFTQAARHHYPHIGPDDLRWALVDLAPTILAELGERLSRTALRILHDRGVDVRLRTTVEEVTASAVRLSDGTTVSRCGSRTSPSRPVWWTRSPPRPCSRRSRPGESTPTRFTTHRFPLHEAIQAYDTFARAGETNALKVLLTAEG